jgi:hypothetical protein
MHQKWSGAELIGEGSGKMEGKGTEATVGDRHFYAVEY